MGTSEQIFHLLVSIFPMTRKLFFRRSRKDQELNPAYLEVLGFVAMNAGCSMSETARAVDLSSPNLTAIVDRLTERRLMERYHDPVDRRMVRLKLAPNGQELLQMTHQEYLQNISERISVLSEAEKKDFLSAMSIVLNIMKKIDHQELDKHK